MGSSDPLQVSGVEEDIGTTSKGPCTHMQSLANRHNLRCYLALFCNDLFKVSLAVLVFIFFHPLFFPLAQNVTIVSG